MKHFVKHLVMFSGGVGSWMAARRVVDKHGTDDVVLLFADTKMEDEDLYRFLDEAADDIGARLVKIYDGRTPWEVFRDVRFLGSQRYDPCSRILKRELLDSYRDWNCDVDKSTMYVGIDWSESHRIERLASLVAPWKYEAPMCEKPYFDKSEMIEQLKMRGIKPPRLYEMGFPHNNCGGFCVKAGIGQFKLLLEKMPERYAFHEQQEREMRSFLGADVSILRDRRGGTTKRMTLETLRKRIENDGQGLLFDELNEWGGCGCAID